MRIKELESKIIGDDLCKLAELLLKEQICKNHSPLDNAGRDCSRKANESEWGYKFDNLDFEIQGMGGTIPFGAEDLNLRFSINVVGEVQNDEEIKNPLKSLNFDIELLGSYYDTQKNDVVSLSSAWHFDKHIPVGVNGITHYSHPEYHATFGGKKMEETSNDYGTTLILPTPRIAYPPMDAVLGIDFILQNYFHLSKITKILRNPGYREIVTKSQDRLWKPYFCSLYSRWYPTEYKFDKSFSPIALFPLFG